MQLRLAIESRVRSGPQKLDMVSWMGRAALEIIGQSGLGHSFDPLVADVEDEYTEAIKSFMYVSCFHGFISCLSRYGR